MIKNDKAQKTRIAMEEQQEFWNLKKGYFHRRYEPWNCETHELTTQSRT